MCKCTECRPQAPQKSLGLNTVKVKEAKHTSTNTHSLRSINHEIKLLRVNNDTATAEILLLFVCYRSSFTNGVFRLLVYLMEIQSRSSMCSPARVIRALPEAQTFCLKRNCKQAPLQEPVQHHHRYSGGQRYEPPPPRG